MNIIMKASRCNEWYYSSAMKPLSPLLLILSTITAVNALSENIDQVSREGTAALANRNWALAILRFDQLVRSDPTSESARKQLSLAYSGYGDSMEYGNPKLALVLYHQAAFYLPSEKHIYERIDRVIERLGKNPMSFEDRKELGYEAFKKSDFKGNYIEFKQALALKEDFALRADFASICNQLGLSEEAAQQANLVLNSSNVEETVREKALFTLRAAEALNGNREKLKEVFAVGLKLDTRPVSSNLATRMDFKKEIRHEEQRVRKVLEKQLSAWKMDRSNPALCYLIGCSYKSQKKYALSIKFLKLCLSLDPQFIQATQRLKEIQDRI